MRQWGVNNLAKVVAQQRHGRGSNPRPLDRKSDALPLSHCATLRWYVCPSVHLSVCLSVHLSVTQWY